MPVSFQNCIVSEQLGPAERSVEYTRFCGRSYLPQQHGIRPAEESATQSPFKPTSQTGRVQTPNMTSVSEIFSQLALRMGELTLEADALVEGCVVATQGDGLLYSGADLAVIISKPLSLVRVKRGGSDVLILSLAL